jgi:3-oxoacyl-[acyl-carrier protein] reductase
MFWWSAYNDAMTDVKNRVALVTGGSRGIGAAIAIALAQAGVDVAVNYRKRVDAASAVCDEIVARGLRAITVQADVSIAADVTRMVAKVEAQLGAVDILVNNAAIAHPRQLQEISEAEWDEVLAVNLKSVFLVTQAVIGGMRERNAIAPALIETDMVTSNPNANPKLIPMGHFGSVEDVASIAVMLATNDYITGQTISVNGGWYMS